MTKLLVAIFIAVSLGSTVSGGHYDITTVYKINVEDLEENGGVITKYLDTCDVSVHPQTNAIDLPYQIINKDQNETTPVIYPLKSPTIPTLNFPSQNSEWKNLTSSGDLKPLQNATLLGVDPLGFFKLDYNKSIFTLFENNSYILKDNHGVIYDRTILNENDMRNIKVKKNAFLHVQVPRDYAKDFSFRFVKSNGLFIKFEIFKSSRTIRVCASWSRELCEVHSYQQNWHNQISLYINLEGKLRMYDANSQKMVSLFESCQDAECSSFLFARIDRTSRYPHYISYKIIQFSNPNVLRADSLIVSPWRNIKNNTSLFVVYYRQSNTSVVSYLKDKVTEELIQLDSEEQQKIELFPNITNDERDVDEVVLTRVIVNYPHNWSEDKQIQIRADKNVFITNVWEGGNLEVYQTQKNIKCVKSNITEIYEVALKDTRTDVKATDCLNGGRLDNFNETCMCPPGFTGDSCEVSCGRNYFGQKCSKFCSASYTDNECKGMILCTPSFGCSCATGYRGEQCLQECEEGTYGADCSQTCGQCTGGCDRYTGDCRGECDSPYLVWPSCKHPRSYWKGSPEILDSSFTSIKLGFDLSSSNLVNTFDKPRFFLVQYREVSNSQWSNCSYESFTSSTTEYSVEKLKPGRTYFFRVLLVDNSLQTNDPIFSKISEGLSKCNVLETRMNMTETKFENSSVVLTWSGENTERENECPFSSYILYFEGLLGSRRISNIKSNSIMVNFLAPGQQFLITLKKRTLLGESEISNITVHTDSITDSSRDKSITGVTSELIDSQLHMHWLKSPWYKTYYIKYKMIRRLSCSQDEIASSLQVVSTSSNSYILSLEAYAQYQIFVTGDPTQESSEHNVMAVSNGKLPDATPSFLNQEFKVSNESVKAYWIDPPSYCDHLNGLFKKYLLNLLDKENTTLKTYETKDGKIEITGLSPKTEYKIRIYYRNNIGYNPEKNEEYVFSTLDTTILPV